MRLLSPLRSSPRRRRSSSLRWLNDPKNANKPDAVKQKMIEGKIKKYFKENCLVDQEFVKDGDMTVGQYTAKVAKDLGGEIKVIKFTHFVKGEGLEKRSDDFAAEVASMGEVI